MTMTMMLKWIWFILILSIIVSFASCADQESRRKDNPPPASFHPETLKIPDRSVKKVRGQVLYMPIYSNLPYLEKKDFDLSAFLAVHNTDLKRQIKITKVTLFNTDGRVVKEYLSANRLLDPLATAIFTISQKDQSGTGANFLVEWIADQPVNEPLVESIMKDLSGNLGLSFLSQGRVIREIQ
jgi:hypothetical protein